MMRAIDADELKESVLKWLPPDPCGQEEKEYPFETDICVSLLMEIEEAPTIEPRMKGKWIDREEDMEGMTLMIKRCSKCGASKPMKIFRLENFEFNYCPNCGAEMERRQDEQTD